MFNFGNIVNGNQLSLMFTYIRWCPMVFATDECHSMFGLLSLLAVAHLFPFLPHPSSVTLHKANNLVHVIFGLTRRDVIVFRVVIAPIDAGEELMVFHDLGHVLV